MPNCCWQLGLGPLISRNQEGLYRGIRHFECIEVIFQICAFSDLRFSAFRLFRLSTCSGSPPFQARCPSRLFAFSGSPLLQVFVFHASTLSSPPLFRVWTAASFMHFYKAFRYYCRSIIRDDQ